MYSNPAGTTNVTIGIAGFVDDCNGQTNNFEADGSTATVSPSLLTHAQRNAQIWTDLLSASGGALEVSKCSCHVIQFKVTIQGAPSLVPSPSPSQVKISVWDPHEQTLHDLKLLSVYEPHKTLGHYKEPTGHQKEQFRQLKVKSDEATAFLWTCPLTRTEAWTFYYACYLTSVGYPRSCVFINDPSTVGNYTTQSHVNHHPKMRVQSKYKTEVIYGPVELGGASFHPLWVQQGIGQVTLFLHQWRKNTQGGQLSRIAVAWFQVQTGVSSFPILEYSERPLPQLESKWIASMRQFLATIKANIVIDDFEPPKLQRLHDFVIMDIMQASGNSPPPKFGD